MMVDLLPNIVWHALSGPQARYAEGRGNARRYARGFSPIVGFADPTHPDFDALAPHCNMDEHLYVDGWTGPAPASWRIDVESTMFKMIWEGSMPDEPSDPSTVVPVGPSLANQALELATLTQPGPFGPRTIELGDYFGVLDDGQLIALAGERMQAGPLREVSGVCTHPDHQGRGLARRLMLILIGRQMQRGETPFLHVMRRNATAVRLYERMGFRTVHESVVRVVSRC